MAKQTKHRILLVNPPIHDFAAYDFWLKPYGLLSIAGYLREKADFELFDYLDRLAPFPQRDNELQSDQWGRGKFHEQRIPCPKPLESIPRHFRRFGIPRPVFQHFLQQHKHFDFALIQTTMTYWYPGAAEVIEDIRRACPNAKIVLGGNYPTLCPDHAATLGADLVIPGPNLEPLWHYLDLTPNKQQPGLWEAYPALDVAALKLSDGCPFKCTYCSVPQVYDKFRPRPLDRSLAELELLASLGAKNVAFYDDALLFDPELCLIPFLNQAIDRNINVNFHCPNALNARFLSAELAQLMVRAGFKTFYLGFESASTKWQNQTGSKVYSEELATAVQNLNSAGANPQNITAYQILGHPHSDTQDLEASIRFVHSLGIRGMLADFSPLPGTPDGEYCRKWVDIDEPLTHNKTAFTITRLTFKESNRLKDLQRKLNRSTTTNP